MEILVKYLGGFNLFTQKEQEIFHPKSHILWDVLLEIASQCPPQFVDEVFTPNRKELKEIITIVLNGKVIPHGALSFTNVTVGDVLAWLPAILGG